MFNIQKQLTVKEILDFSEDGNVSLCILLQGEASYNGQAIHTVTDGQDIHHVEGIIYYNEIEGESDWYGCDNMQSYQIGESVIITDNLPAEVQDWLFGAKAQELIDEVISGKSTAPRYLDSDLK